MEPHDLQNPQLQDYLNWIEQRPTEPQVARSNRAGCTSLPCRLW